VNEQRNNPGQEPLTINAELFKKISGLAYGRLNFEELQAVLNVACLGMGMRADSRKDLLAAITKPFAVAIPPDKIKLVSVALTKRIPRNRDRPAYSDLITAIAMAGEPNSALEIFAFAMAREPDAVLRILANLHGYVFKHKGKGKRKTALQNRDALDEILAMQKGQGTASSLENAANKRAWAQGSDRDFSYSRGAVIKKRGRLKARAKQYSDAKQKSE